MLSLRLSIDKAKRLHRTKKDFKTLLQYFLTSWHIFSFFTGANFHSRHQCTWWNYTEIIWSICLETQKILPNLISRKIKRYNCGCLLFWDFFYKNFIITIESFFSVNFNNIFYWENDLFVNMFRKPIPFSKFQIIIIMSLLWVYHYHYYSIISYQPCTLRSVLKDARIIYRIDLHRSEEWK